MRPFFFKDNTVLFVSETPEQAKKLLSSLTNGFCSCSALLGLGVGEGEERQGEVCSATTSKTSKPKQSLDRGQLKLMGPKKDVSLLLNS